jgi:hypothetical protein
MSANPIYAGHTSKGAAGADSPLYEAMGERASSSSSSHFAPNPMYEPARPVAGHASYRQQPRYTNDLGFVLPTSSSTDGDEPPLSPNPMYEGYREGATYENLAARATATPRYENLAVPTQRTSF